MQQMREGEKFLGQDKESCSGEAKKGSTKKHHEEAILKVCDPQKCVDQETHDDDVDDLSNKYQFFTLGNDAEPPGEILPTPASTNRTEDT